MSCSTEFIEGLCEMLSPLGEVRSRKMMGDYVIYLNEKCVITACDNIAFVKKLPCLTEILAGAECGASYPGAKEAYILDLTDNRKVLAAVETLWNNLPFPKPKKK